jgi:acyl carrier protein
MTDTQQWLLDLFSSKGRIPGETTDQQLDVDYFEVALIDSLELVELVETIEETFGVRFQSAHLQDIRFRRIGGLAEVIDELRRGSGS